MNSPRGHQKRSGLAFAEIIVALLLFAVAGLALIGVFTKLLVKSSVDSDTVAAELLANTILERARAEGPPDWGVAGLSPTVHTEQIQTADRTQPTIFSYRLEVVSLGQQDLGEIYRMGVSVQWGSGGNSPGKGRQTVERFTLFYDEAKWSGTQIPSRIARRMHGPGQVVSLSNTPGIPRSSQLTRDSTPTHDFATGFASRTT